MTDIVMSEKGEPMDLIERQAVIDALRDWYDGMIISSFRGIEKVIKALPSVQPEREGQWMPDKDCYSEMRFICSQCQKSEAVPTTRFVDYYKPIWNFCPHCGARMWG